MRRLTHIPSWVKRLLSSPGTELTRWQRALRFAIDLTRHCAGELRYDRAAQMAAALTYHTLFSLLPTLVLMLVGLNVFASEDRRAMVKDQIVNFAISVVEADSASNTTLTQNQSNAPPPTQDAEQTPGRRNEFVQVRESLDERIQATLDALETVNFGSISIVGLLVFIYGATALLATTERSFNTIFATTSARPWYHRLPLYYTVITLGPTMLILAQVFQERLFGFLESGGGWTNWLIGPAAVVAPLLAIWGVLFAMYSWLPYTRVAKRPAAVGSFVAAILWVLAKEAFRFYVAHAAISTLYGALALLPLFLLWIYVTWLIILFGLELTYTLGAMKGRRFKHEAHRPLGEAVLDPACVVPLAARVADAFHAGRAATAEDLARSLHLPPRAMRRLINALTDANVIRRVDNGTASAYTLARPADAIPIDKLLQTARSLMPSRQPGSEASNAWRLVDRLWQAERDAADGRTLADVLPTRSTSHSPSPQNDHQPEPGSTT